MINESSILSFNTTRKLFGERAAAPLVLIVRWQSAEMTAFDRALTISAQSWNLLFFLSPSLMQPSDVFHAYTGGINCDY